MQRLDLDVFARLNLRQDVLEHGVIAIWQKPQRCTPQVFEIQVYRNPLPAKPLCGLPRSTASTKYVDDKIPRIRKKLNEKLWKCFGESRGMRRYPCLLA